MSLVEAKIQEKIYSLPENVKNEVLDFVEYLSTKYQNEKQNVNDEKKTNLPNPFSELSGFVEMGNMTSSDIDKEVYGL